MFYIINAAKKIILKRQVKGLTYQDKKKFIINVLYIITIVGILYFVFKYMLSWIMPFIIGFIIAYLLKPVGHAIGKATKFKNRNISIFVISFFYISIIILIGLIIANVWGLIYKFIRILPNLYNQNIEPAILSMINWAISSIDTLSPEIAGLISNVFNNMLDILTTGVSNISKTVLFGVTRFAQRIPIYFITLLFSIICSVLITIDYDNVSHFIKRQIPEKAYDLLFDIKKILVGTILKMVRAYVILSFIAFIEMSLGFVILGIDHPIAISAFIAILDVLPLIGIGGILIPWGIYEIVIGQRLIGIGLLVIYIIAYILRSSLEPRIIGKQIGLNSLATIVAMFVGFKLFGFMGFIIAPIIAIVIKQLNDNGKINVYK